MSSERIANPDRQLDLIPERIDVLVLVGTDVHPFDRVVRWVDDWAATHPQFDVVQQVGTSVTPSHSAWVRLMTAEELHRGLEVATLVVTHGGPGTIGDALAHGRRPIVVPRDPSHGEHVDDHQLRFAREIVARGDGLIATIDDVLVEHLDKGLTEPSRYRCQPAAHDGSAAVSRFNRLLDELGATGPSARRRRVKVGIGRGR